MLMSYIVYDEEGQPMRIIGRKEEAIALCALRSGWTYKYMKAKKAEEYKFEEALF
jgi:hypothetical protein